MTIRLTKERKAALLSLSQNLGVAFSDLGLLHEALTHTSFANEARGKNVVHNERLEFLGDAVLELATSTYLYRHSPQKPEGEMTKARASVVREATLSKLAARLHLGDYLLLGHGETTTGGAHRPSILADAFEAVIGAIYLDQGWDAAFHYVMTQLHEDFLTIDSGKNMQDYKTILQEVVQRKAGGKIIYDLLRETGPDHDKTFEFAALVNGQILGTGRGRNKKEAEQRAAEEALAKIKR